MTGLGPTARKRLLVLTEMDRWSASTRYRALQHVARLRPSFERVEVSLPGDPVTCASDQFGRWRHFGAHVARYSVRALSVRAGLADADVAFVQRGLYPIGPGLVASGVIRFEGRVVLDLDDAVFAVKPSLADRGALRRWLYGRQQAVALLHRADAIVVSTTELADALPAGVAPATILPTVPDPSRYSPVDHDENLPAVVGWAGTVGNLQYLDPLRPVFERLAGESVARLEVVCSHPWNGPSTFHAWTLAEEADVFRRFCIGIMPLPETQYTRAKAGFKLLQYMAAGLPVVASPVGVNRKLIERSNAGLLAAGADEWESALRELAADPDLRRRLGRNGRAFVEAYADLDGQANTLAKLLGAS